MRHHPRPSTFGATSFAILLLLANQVGMTAVMASTGGGAVASSPFDSNGDGQVDGADLAPVLANWGGGFTVNGDFNGDCQVDSADLGLLLSAWGPVTEPGPGPVRWTNKTVSICLGPGIGTIDAEISGWYSPMSGIKGDPCAGGFGEFDVTLGGVVTNQISMSPNGIVGFGFDCKIAMDPTQAVDEISIDGINRPVETLLDGAVQDYEDHGDDVFDWDCYTQMMMSMTVVLLQEDMVANIPQPCGEPSVWCRTFAYLVAGLVGASGIAACGSLKAACAAGTVPTLGGITLPCATWIFICNAFFIGGTAGAYDAALSSCS